MIQSVRSGSNVPDGRRFGCRRRIRWVELPNVAVYVPNVPRRATYWNIRMHDVEPFDYLPVLRPDVLLLTVLNHSLPWCVDHITYIGRSLQTF